MALNLNTSPYFDDFDKDKNHNRILFKPGVAVQARELTQVQTILQEQISGLGSFTLKEGAIMSGCEEGTYNVDYIKINDLDPDSEVVNNLDLTKYVGDTIVGSITGLEAKILSSSTGDEGAHPASKTFYIKYTGGDLGTNSHFIATETLTIADPSNYSGISFVVNDQGSDNLNVADRYYGSANRLQLSEGIVYLNGQFVVTEKISTFIDPYSLSQRRKVGFEYTESIVTAASDTSLLDPASGSYNYNAPGADRYKIAVSLKSYPLSTTPPNNFIQYCTYEGGQQFKTRLAADPLSKIGDYFAQQAYAANGNYVISGLKVDVREHLLEGSNGGVYTAGNGGDESKFVVEISPGQANVGGRYIDYEKAIHRTYSKPTDTVTVQDTALTTAYGNYVLTTEVCGTWDIDGSATVQLYDTVQGKITSTEWSSGAIAGLRVGTAKVRHVVHESGTPGAAACQYRIYLYDIKIENGNFTGVRSIYFDNPEITDQSAFADLVLEGGDAIIKEATQNRLLWRMPKTYIKDLQPDGVLDYSFFYQAEMDATLSTAGATSIGAATLGTNRTFNLAEGNPNNTILNANFMLIANDDMTIDSVTYKKGQIIDVTSTGFLNSIDVNAGQTTVDIDLGVTCAAVTGLEVKILISAKVQDSDPIEKTLLEDRYVKLDAGKTPYVSTSTSFSLGITDVLDVVTITASNNADYTTGAIDVSSDFVLDNGQRDNFYGFSKILKKPTSTLDLSTYRYLSVKVDYFSRSSTSGQPSFSVIDSYPVSTLATLPAGSIRYQQVPLYPSSLGTTYDLRDSLDFRPYATNTAANSTTLIAATINPVITEIIDASLGLTMPIPIKDFTTDIESYLAQAYRVALDPDGDVAIIVSPQSEQIEIPALSSKLQMTLATFFLKPYPSLTPLSAKYWNRKDYSINVKLASNPAYTMKSIGALEQRISNLEYYTALNSIEQQAKDTKFLDSSGIERFKNGLLVDAFTGHGVSHVGNPDYKVSIDTTKRELRAYFNDDVINWKPFSTGVTDSAQSGDVFHIPYHEIVYTEQLQASKYEEIVTELLIRDTDDIPPLPPQPPAPVPAPVTPSTRTYNLVRRTGTHVDEGQLITIELNTVNVPENTTVGWTVSGILPADLSSGATTGTFTVSSGGTASATWRLANDSVTEGSETFTLTLDAADSDTVTTGATATNITVNDTSIAPLPATPTVPVCIAPYVLNAAGTACIAPACASGYVWNASTQTCEQFRTERDNYSGNLSLTPNEQNDIDTDVADPVYSNVEGTFDQFEYDSAGWNTEWGSWSKVSSRATGETRTEGTKEELISTSRGKFKGTDPGEISWGENGKDYYDTVDLYETIGTYSVYEYGTQEILNSYERTGTYIWGGGSPDPIVGKLIGEVTVWDNYKPYCKAQTIRWNVSGLAPSTTHKITMDGTTKGTFTSDTAGRASGSFNIATRELSTSNGGGTGYSVLIQNSRTSSSAVKSRAESHFTVYGFGTISTSKEYERILPPAGSPKNSQTITDNNTSTTWAKWTGDTVTNKKITGDIWEESNTTYNVPIVQPAVTRVNTDISVAPGTEIVVGREGDGEPVVTVSPYFPLPEVLPTYKIPTISAPSTNYTAPTVEPIDKESDPYVGISEEEEEAIAASLDIFLGDLGGGFDCLWGFDPMAQTFTVEGFENGIYVSSVDIFFHRIGFEEDNNGVTLELREVINGYPGPKVIARRHLNRNECSGSAVLPSGLHTPRGTKFVFDAPVFLESGLEYCIVPIPDRDDPNYFVWIAELGGNQQGTDTIINKQAHTGILFTSANNRTWTPRQKEDLMFRINRATFSTNTDYSVNLNNGDEDWIEFDTFSTGTEFELGTEINGFTFDITNAGTGYTSAPTVTFTDPTGRGSGATATATTDGNTITAITLTNPGSGYQTSPTLSFAGGGGANVAVTATLNRGVVMTNRTDTYNTSTIRVVSGYFTTSDLVGNGDATANITTIHNRVVNDYALMGRKTNIGDVGEFRPKLALTTTGAGSVNTTVIDTYWEKTITTRGERTIYAYSNEQLLFAGAKSVTAQIVLSTPLEHLSPMVNVESMNMRTFTNYINNSATDENGRNGGDAYSRYISKRVTLADGQDAEDFKVYLDNKIPSTGSVRVYCKLINISDDADFLEDIYWNEMEVEQSPPNLANEGWAEWLYKLPLKASGFGLNGSGVLEYDVDRVGSIGVISSGAGYTSAPGVKIEHSGTGYGATAVSVITGGAVTSIDMLDPGRGYTGGTVTVTVGDQYENSTAYSVGDQIQADTANLYTCVTAGTSAAAGAGPTGVGAGITDGTAVFDYTSAAAVVGTVTTNTVTYSGFKKYAVKIVHLSSDTSKIPKTTNLRAYALQV